MSISHSLRLVSNPTVLLQIRRRGRQTRYTWLVRTSSNRQDVLLSNISLLSGYSGRKTPKVRLAFENAWGIGPGQVIPEGSPNICELLASLTMTYESQAAWSSRFRP